MRISIELSDGRKVDAIALAFKPLGVVSLRAAFGQSREPVRLMAKVNITHFEGGGEIGAAQFASTVALAHRPFPVALVPNGWLPLPFVIPQHYLVDRNIVSHLKKLKKKEIDSRLIDFDFWLRQFDPGSALFNPLLYAFEGGFRRPLDRLEFESAYLEAKNEIESLLPGARVVQFDKENFDQAFVRYAELVTRGSREESFLMQTVPLIVNRVSRSRERDIESRIIEAADELQIRRNDLVVLATLSVLYESIQGAALSIGRRIVKPQFAYSRRDAFNAISDLRNVELAAMSHAALGNESFSLCTNDLALAEFWCSIECAGSAARDGSLEINYAITNDLLPRLDNDECGRIANLIDCS